jgi:Tol biopolymer transport system component
MALIQPTWSPDGHAVAYGTARLGTAASTESAPDINGETRGDIWMMRADGSGSVQLTDGSGVHFGAAWGVDGRVYFSSRQDGSENIWSVRAEIASAPPMAAQPASAEKAAAATHLPARGG